MTEFKMLDEVKTLNAGLKAAAVSSNKNSRAMNWLTGTLVFLALAQVLVAWLNYQADQSVTKAKESCYRSVLQTSDIDLNYKSCLRSKGLSD